MRYQFTDACIIGVEQLDNEHRELFKLIGEAHDLLEDKNMKDKYNYIQLILDRLKKYAADHFAHEEAYMEKIQHPELAKQKKQHAYFVEKLKEIDLKGISENQEETIDEILTFLVKWLYQHIIGQDIMIGKLEPRKKMEYKGGFPDEFKTGIMMIDAEHKELFRIFDEMKELLEDELLPDKYDLTVHLLEELREYAENHFRDEEKYMEQINYKGLEAQKRAHQSYIDYIDELDLENIDDNQQDGLRDILDFLTGWLVNHILRMDKKIG